MLTTPAIALICRVHINLHASGLKTEIAPVNDIYFHDMLLEIEKIFFCFLQQKLL